MSADAREAIESGRGVLGLEFGSTRIKATLIDRDNPATVLAAGSHEWENALVDGVWTYALEDVWTGAQAAFAALAADALAQHGARPTTLAAVGVSAMMHGYLAFDADGELLVPFRTWRNTMTGDAAAELATTFGVNIPLRWSIAHLHHAVRGNEPHVPRIAHITTLAGYVHEQLTAERVLGVGDASGMFPIDPTTGDYDARMLDDYDALVAGTALRTPLRALLPRVAAAGASAGVLSDAGAALLDPSGQLAPGALACPPEGDAGTGMVATGAIAPRTGNVSAGTSIFAMVVLEQSLSAPHADVDIVTTPVGDPVAMVHCNNGASELAAWANVFREFASAHGGSSDSDDVFDTLLRAALTAEADAGGVLAYNQLAGEPVASLEEGRPMVVRTPEASLTLANLMRAQLAGVFATLAMGMRVLADEGVAIDDMFAHGGVFRTAGAAQRVLADALGSPVSVAATASEGGAWGMGVLAAYAATVAAASAHPPSLAEYLRGTVFRGAEVSTVTPSPTSVADYARYLDRYSAGLDAVRAAAAIPTQKDAS